MPSSSPPPDPRDDGYVAMVPTPVKDNQRPFDSISAPSDVLGTPTAPRQELRHRNQHHQHHLHGGAASFSHDGDDRFEGIGADDDHVHNRQQAKKKRERKLNGADTANTAATNGEASTFSLDALFGPLMSSVVGSTRGVPPEEEHDAQPLDAPLLCNEQGDQQATSTRASIGSAGRRRRGSEISQHANNSNDNDNDPSGSPTVPQSRREEIFVKVKEGTWTVACNVLDAIIPNNVAGKFFVPHIKESVRQKLHDFQEAILIPFSHDDPSHQAQIRLLWDALAFVRPPLPFAGDMDRETYRSELWKDYGFQGMDPGTDFRGAGLLGLRVVIWMCREEPDLSRAMVDSGYFFAIAVINVVMALMNILHLTKGKRTCLETSHPNLNFTSQEARFRLSNILGAWQNQPSMSLPPPPPGPPGSGTDSEEVAVMEDALFTMTAEACRVLHGEWMRSKRNVMEFNSVLKVAKVRFEVLLRDKETHLRISRAIDKKYPEVPLSCSGI